MCYCLLTITAMIFALLAMILIEFYMNVCNRSMIRIHGINLYTPSTYLDKLATKSAKIQSAIYTKVLSWNIKHKCEVFYNSSVSVGQSAFFVVFPHLRDVDLMYYLDLILNQPQGEINQDAFKSPEAKRTKQSPPETPKKKSPSRALKLQKRQMYTGSSSAAQELNFDDNKAESPSENKQSKLDMSNRLPQLPQFPPEESSKISPSVETTWISGSDMLVNGNDANNNNISGYK